MKAHRWWVLALAAAVLTVACGDTASSGSPTTGPAAAGTEGDAAAGFPVEVGGVTVESAPERIVSLSASHTEMLYAVGAGDRVIATDLFSDYPPAATTTERIDAFNLSVEAVSVLDPDLVLLAFDPGEVVAGLDALGIPAVLFDPPSDIDGAFTQMLVVGDLVGEPAAAAALVAGLRDDLEALLGPLPEDGLGLTYYHELDASYFTVTSDTFIGSVYGLLGMESVADRAEGSGTGYLQLSAEYLFAADPDVILLADTKCCGVDSATVAERPGWDRLSAVAEGRVIELDDDIASRWGPRIVDFVAEVVSRAPVPVGS